MTVSKDEAIAMIHRLMHATTQVAAEARYTINGKKGATRDAVLEQDQAVNAIFDALTREQ